MKKTIAFVAVLVLAVASLITVQSTPAVAADVCAGAGIAHAGASLSYPSGPTKTTSFGMNIDAGTCTSGQRFSATGTITGHCGLFSGSGHTTTGKAVQYNHSGTLLLLSGEAVGVFVMTEQLASSPNCRVGGTRWWVAGAVAVS